MQGNKIAAREKLWPFAHQRLLGCGILTLYLTIAAAAYAAPAGNAYAGLLTKGDWRNLQQFYALYYLEELRLVKEFQEQLAMLRRHNSALDALLEKNDAHRLRCRANCDRIARLNNRLREVNKLLSKARGRAIANSRLLMSLVQASTRANADFTDAQAAYELRKLGFDLPKLVADTFSFDFGPLLAQLAKHLGAEEAAGLTKAVGSVASHTFERNQLGRFYPKKEGLTRVNFKQALGSAGLEELAKQLIPAKDASAELIKSFMVNVTSGLWLKLNELAAESKAMTRPMIAEIVMKSLVLAFADAAARQVNDDVERAREDTKRSESRRLLTIAEWKAMMHLRRVLNGNSLERGLAQELNWETGHLRHLSGQLCPGVRKEMPRTPPAAHVQSQSMQDVKAPLRRAVRILQKINQELREILRTNDKQACGHRKTRVAIAVAIGGRLGRSKTEAGSGKFHPGEEVPEKGPSGKPGERIVVKLGVRGTAVPAQDSTVPAQDSTRITKLKRRLLLVLEAHVRVRNLTKLWQDTNAILREEQVAGRDKSDLLRIRDRFMKMINAARDDEVELLRKYGDIRSLEEKIRALDPSFSLGPLTPLSKANETLDRLRKEVSGH